MKKLSFLMLTIFLNILTARAQTLTIHNQTGCDLMIYSGMVNVNGTTYSFGSEVPGVSQADANSTIIFTIQSIPPPPPSQTPLVNYSDPSSGTTSYIMFKYRLPNVSGPYTGVGFVGTANPYSVSGPTPPGGCNSGNAYTVVWTETADNPVVYILP